MSDAKRRAAGERKVEARYHRSRLPGLHCSTLVDAGPPRACVHDRYTLLTLTAGQALVWCRGETHTLAPGSLLMLEPGDVHRDIRKTRYSALSVSLRGDLMEALRGRDDGQRLASSIARCQTLCAAAVELVDSVRERRDSAAQERRTLDLLELLAPFWTNARRRTEPALVARAYRALAEPTHGGLSLEELATRLRCAPTYLCRVFSKHIGIGPHAYQLQRRLLEASRLIESGRSVSAAAKLTGFGDASHLGRHFRRRFAVAPGRYQKELAPPTKSAAMQMCQVDGALQPPVSKPG